MKRDNYSLLLDQDTNMRVRFYFGWWDFTSLTNFTLT